MFSAFFGVIAFVAVLIFGSGGTGHGLRLDLAFTAGGIAFIVCLVIAAMLSMTYKENADHLGTGSGVNLRSEDRLKHHGPEAGGARSEDRRANDGDGTEDRGANGGDGTAGEDAPPA
jgi:hypothetical protein